MDGERRVPMRFEISAFINVAIRAGIIVGMIHRHRD